MHPAHPTAPGRGPAWPEVPPDRRIVFLAETNSRLERRLIEEWIEAARPESRAPEDDRFVTLPSGRRRSRRQRLDELDPALEAVPETADDPLCAPLRVIWRARQRPDGRRVTLLELMTAGDPRDPNWLRQAIVVRRSPDRCQIVAGEPALLSDLRVRWTRASGSHSGETQGLARFIAQKATLALERAERGVRGAQYKVPRLVHEEVLGRPGFRAGLASVGEAIRRETGRAPSPAALASRAAKNLKEIAATHSPLVIDLVNQLIRWLYTRSYDEELLYDPAAMKGIAALEEQHPVVFLPTHKSNLDHLVLQSILHENGLPPNHTAGGINMNFFPVGPLVRRSGVFFIRRSFKNDPVYRHVLASYIDYLIEKRFPLEWYIEGGRSRSGKLLPPRYGLLVNVVDAFERGKSDDVYLVPVSIAYDQIPDLESYVSEQQGAAKQQEGFSWFIGLLRKFGRRYGKIQIGFGEPLSLRKQLGAPRSDPGASGDAKKKRTLAVQKLAFEVSDRINRVTPITPTSLVTLALLGATGQALTISETRQSLANLLSFVRHRKLPTTSDFHHLDTDAGLEIVLGALVDTNVLTRFDGGLEPVYGIGEGQQLAAAYYRNTVVHFFVVPAIAELALLHAMDARRAGADPVESFWDEVMRLRDLLKFEFFFSGKRRFRAEIQEELEHHTAGWEAKLRAGEVLPEDLAIRAKPFSAHRVLRPFLESYRVVADRLASLDPAAPVDEKRFLADCLGLGKQYALQQRIHGADSVSKALFQTALRLARHRGLLDGEPETLGPARFAFAEELADAVRRVDIVVTLAAQRRAGFRRETGARLG